MSHMALLLACVVLGFIAHLAKSIVSLRKKNPEFSCIQYLKTYEYHFVLNICLTSGMFLAIYDAGYMNGMTAFFTGFASNSVVSIFRSHWENANKIIGGQTTSDSDTSDEPR